MDLQSLASQAVAFHQQGRLEEAEALYFQILEAEPKIFGPRFYLGLLRLQQGRNVEAAEFLKEALKIFPDNLEALMSYGMALRAAGNASEALASFERVLQIQPNMAEGHYNRGVALADLSRFEQAVESYDQALALQPEFVSALVNRGVALAALSRFDDAIANYDRVLAMQPSNVVAMNNRALALRASQRLAEALDYYERALSLKPDYIDARYNLAVVFMELKRADEALRAFEVVMAVRPNDAELLNNRAVALWNLKRPAEALASCDRALAIEPGFAQAWGNRGLALRDLARYPEALQSFDKVIAISPNNAVAWNGRGNVLRDMKRFDDAIASYSRAIEIRPDYVEALNNRGYSFWADKHEYAQALRDLERAIEIEPDHPYALGEILHLKMYGADWSDYQERKDEIETAVRLGQRAARPFMFQAISQSPQDLQACSRIWTGDMYPEIPSIPLQPGQRGGRHRIRLGYVSGEFREQATQMLMAGLYELHDRSRFEVVALDNGDNDGSLMRKRLEAAFDKWIDIKSLSDEEAAGRIREEEIDILINLNGYFGRPRMGVFARKPSPIQVNFLGFPATLGARYIDYLIADRIVIPETEQEFYDEKIVYLPHSYQVNDSRGRPVSKAPSRREAGLPADGFVFCNFNNAYKLTPDCFAGWMRILHNVESSILWLLESQPPFAQNLRRTAQACGIDPQRIIFAPDLAPDEHMARLQLADLFLDSLPYNGHTTASDALWAGVPLVTRRGSSFPGRVGASLLAGVELAELVTESQSQYEDLAVSLAKDTSLIKTVRDKLVRNRTRCNLFNTELYCRNIESAFLEMWENWVKGEKAQGFSV